MKKKIVWAAAVCLALTGCSGPAADGDRMTQAIAAESSGFDTTEAATATEAIEGTTSFGTEGLSEPPSGTEGQGQMPDYYVVKAEIEATKLDMEALEAKYRIGETDKTSFETERASLLTQKEELENRKRELREPGFGDFRAEDFTSQDMQALRIRLDEYEREEDQLDQEEDRLEAGYLAGNLTREEFVQQQAALSYEDDQLDEKKDQLEDYLEKMGWED